MSNAPKTPPLRLCRSGSREAYKQQLAIERRLSCQQLAERQLKTQEYMLAELRKQNANAIAFAPMGI